jgi:nitroreductase
VQVGAAEALVLEFFEGPPTVDRLEMLAPDCIWWNGLGRIPGAERVTEFVGRRAIGEFLLGGGGHTQLSTGETVDRYDLSTARFADVVTLARDELVFRQHTFRARTVGGQSYENRYAFLFRFRDDGLVDRIWEHWNTLAAQEQLFTAPSRGCAADDVLTTTRAVRRRLDLTRPVSRAVVLECLDLALQAPNGSNSQPWHWVLVDDPELRAELARIYAAAMDDHVADPSRPATPAASDRIATSVFHLREHLHEVPLLVLPVVEGRTDRERPGASSLFDQSSRWSSILPAAWSFMLALRSRGLGSCWTTLHLRREAEAANALGIPTDTHMQAGLIPVAWTIGDSFHRARRAPVEEVATWNGWSDREPAARGRS